MRRNRNGTVSNGGASIYDCDGEGQMSEIGDDFKAVKAFQRAKKLDNKVRSTKMLDGENINYESKNSGNHLIVTADGIIIDFWPTTGLWRARGGKQGRGVKNLIKLIQGENHAR